MTGASSGSPAQVRQGLPGLPPRQRGADVRQQVGDGQPLGHRSRLLEHPPRFLSVPRVCAHNSKTFRFRPRQQGVRISSASVRLPRGQSSAAAIPPSSYSRSAKQPRVGGAPARSADSSMSAGPSPKKCYAAAVSVCSRRSWTYTWAPGVCRATWAGLRFAAPGVQAAPAARATARGDRNARGPVCGGCGLFQRQREGGLLPAHAGPAPGGAASADAPPPSAFRARPRRRAAGAWSPPRPLCALPARCSVWRSARSRAGRRGGGTTGTPRSSGRGAGAGGPGRSSAPVLWGSGRIPRCHRTFAPSVPVCKRSPAAGRRLCTGPGT